MRLRYKPYNEILDVVITSRDNKICVFCPEKLSKTINFHDYEWHYDSVGAFNKDWEDYKEEPIKPYWFINDLDGQPMYTDWKHCGKSDFIRWRENRKKFGNYFKTKKEAEKAAEKLKAWKWLKDSGIKFLGWSYNNLLADEENINIKAILPENFAISRDDLNLLFGCEE